MCIYMYVYINICIYMIAHSLITNMPLMCVHDTSFNTN